MWQDLVGEADKTTKRVGEEDKTLGVADLNQSPIILQGGGHRCA